MTDLRHPLDPDPVRSSKAVAVLALGIAAAVTGPLVGGLVPATLGLVLARQARAEFSASHGFLLGGRRLRLGVRLSWVGVVLAIVSVVVAGIVGLLALAGPAGKDFAPNLN